MYSYAYQDILGVETIAVMNKIKGSKSVYTYSKLQDNFVIIGHRLSVAATIHKNYGY